MRRLCVSVIVLVLVLVLVFMLVLMVFVYALTQWTKQIFDWACSLSYLTLEEIDQSTHIILELSANCGRMFRYFMDGICPLNIGK